jgi:hypothetical protein
MVQATKLVAPLVDRFLPSPIGIAANNDDVSNGFGLFKVVTPSRYNAFPQQEFERRVGQCGVILWL